jgi:hypothetical protein
MHKLLNSYTWLLTDDNIATSQQGNNTVSIEISQRNFDFVRNSLFDCGCSRLHYDFDSFPVFYFSD